MYGATSYLTKTISYAVLIRLKNTLAQTNVYPMFQAKQKLRNRELMLPK